MSCAGTCSAIDESSARHFGASMHDIRFSKPAAFVRASVRVIFALVISAPTHAVIAQASTAWTLESVLRAAVVQHPLVDAADARTRAARGGRVTAGAFGNPVLTYQVENAAFPGRDTPAGFTRETSTYGTLPLEPLWQRGPRVRRAEAEIQVAEAEAQQLRRQVVLDAARVFNRVALAQAGVEAADDLQRGLDTLLRYTRTRVREGASAEGDAIRLEVERDRVGTERALLEAERAQARAALSLYLGVEPRDAGQSIRVAGFGGATDTAVAHRPLPPSAYFTAQALAQRPDVAVARARARAAASEVRLQQTLLPRQAGATFGSRSTGGIHTMIAGVSLPLPLFDQNRGERQRATGERDAVERELAWIERRAASEVRGAYEAARVLSEQVTHLQRGFLARAEESRRIAVAAYREGAVPLLQVIDATRTLGEARLTSLRAALAEQESRLVLYGAAGLDPASALTPSTTSAGENAP